jgi:uncharacterized damage-inducible protein DinB
MSWTAPEVSRVEEPFTGDERAILEGFLEWHRATLLWKCAGLTGEQLAQRPVPPSELSLLGLMRHLADVERSWFRRYFRGEQIAEVYAREDRPDAAFEEASAAGAEADFECLARECDMARKAVAGASLDEQFTYRSYGPYSLRWVYNHMIEEYARHNGHADLLRQCIDGVTGC